MLLLVVALVVTAPVTPASADPGCGPGQVPQEIPGQGVICVPASDPGGGGGGGSTPGPDPDGGGVSSTCLDSSANTIACSLNGLAWFSSHSCYAGALVPPPPGTEAFYPAGEGPDTGLLFECRYQSTGAPYLAAALIFFVANGQVPVALIDPGILAERALDQMRLATPNMHSAPQAPDMTYVGLETWLWMDPAQWDTLELTVTAGTTSVTVTAAPVRATWDLTTGSTTCTSAGRAWVAGMTSAEQTDCSYVWSQTSDGQAEDAFAVSSTLTYQVDWACSGACLRNAGTLGEVDGVPGAAAIRVGERQSVVIGGN